MSRSLAVTHVPRCDKEFVRDENLLGQRVSIREERPLRPTFDVEVFKGISKNSTLGLIGTGIAGLAAALV
jgi:hypothetical protein